MYFLFKKIVQFFLSRLLLKIITLGLAIVLWLVVQGRQQLEISSKLDVLLVPDKTLALKVPEVITKDITIRGPRAMVEGLDHQPLKATVFLPAEKGINRIRIEKGFLDQKWDSRMDLTIHEPYITVDVDTKISKTLPIKVVLQGTPGEGHQVEKISSTPRNVTLSGASSLINELSQIKTSAVSIQNRTKDFTEEVDLEMPSLVNAMFSEDKVHVNIAIVLEKINKLYEDVLVEVQGTNLLANPLPNQVNIVLQSDLPTLEAIKSTDLGAFVQAQDLKAGQHELSVQVQIPPGTTLVETVPEKIRVNLYKNNRQRR